MTIEEDAHELQTTWPRHLPIRTPPCSRHGVGEDDERLIRLWCYVMGALGTSKALRLSERVARLHDHNGTLSVVMRRSIPARGEATLREGVVCRRQGAGRARPVHPGARDFLRGVWKNRGFESYWSSHTPSRVFHLRRLGAWIEPAQAI